MRLRRETIRIAFAAAAVAAGITASNVVAGEQRPTRLQLTDDQARELLVLQRAGRGQGIAARDPKIASSLMEVAESQTRSADWRSVAVSNGLLVEGGSVLTEMRLDPDAAEAAVWHVRKLGGEVRNHNAPGLLEVWLPVAAIEQSAENRDVLMIRPARLVRPMAGSVTSEGVEAININTSAVAYDYHDLSADGTGVTIASIDAGYSGYVALQASGDWPPSARLGCFEVDGGPVTDCDSSTCSNYEASEHGAATMEIAYDVAPGADYLTYRTTTVGDWYAALVHAADNGADIVTVSLSAPLDNVGDGGVCPPNTTSPCGTIAEAAEYAHSQGVLMVTSAGNYRMEHWGGPYVDSGSGYLDWGGGAEVNYGLYCRPNGATIGVDLFWDDWSAVSRDYDVELLEYTRWGWFTRTTSTYPQTGNPGDGETPQEAIRYLVSGAWGGRYNPYCDSGYGLFGIVVVDNGGGAGGNLQVFTHDFIELSQYVPERSLGFPADSPDVVAAGAVGLATPGTVEEYSSEGPVLGPGGTQAAPSPANPKPDLVSISDVSTVSYAPDPFGGTSSAAPHAAGVAAVLTQLRNEKYDTPPTSNNPDGMANQLHLFALEDPTFPSTFDTTYGNGLLKLRFCDETLSVGAEEFVMVGLPCNQRGSMTVGDLFGGILAGDYGLWTWDAGAQAYDAIYTHPAPASEEMKPGVGYWAWYENAFTVTMQGLVRDRTEPYRMALTGESPGLGRPNLLGHTFDFDVAWPEVVVYSGGSEYDLDGAVSAGIIRNIMWKPYTATGYTESDGTASPAEGTFNAFDGYWVKALADCEIGIPVSPSTAAGSEGRGDAGLGGRGWTVALSATLQGVTASARIGQLAEAESARDLRDVELMPSVEAHQFYVVMPHPDWGVYAGDYVRDYHALQRGGDTWRFEVTSNVGGSVVLRWDGPRYALRTSVITDLETGEALPAVTLQNEGYRFDMRPGVHRFEWRVR